MFYVTVANGLYRAEWRELDSTKLLGVFNSQEKAQAICDKYWDEVVFPVRKKRLAKYQQG